MASVAPAAAEQPPIFSMPADRTPLQEAVAAELGDGLAEGFLVLPSQVEGLVQAGAPAASFETVDFGASRKPCPTAVTARATPGRLVAADAAPMLWPHCGGEMARSGDAPMTLWHLPQGMDRTKIVVSRQRWVCTGRGRTRVDEAPFKAAGRRCTVPLLNFVCDLLSLGQTLKAVYDRFHLAGNFNEKVISAVRKDEQARLKEAGGEEAAKALKGSKRMLMTSASTRSARWRAPTA